MRIPLSLPLLLALCLVALLIATSLAFAGPGEPRLMQGSLEWPTTLSGESFIVVRADDGRLYYVDISSAQRRMPGAITGGARVAVLGIEGAKVQEVTALAIGAGDATALARAITSGAANVRPDENAAIVAPPVASVTSPATVAPGTQVASRTPEAAATAPSPAPAPPPAALSASPPAAASAPVVASAPAPASSPAAAPAPTPAADAAPKIAATATATATPPVAATAPVVQPPPAAPAMSDATVQAAPSTAPAAIMAASTPSASGVSEGRRWVEVRGIVQSVTGRTLVLRGEDGNLFAVDVSGLNADVAGRIKPGTTVAVFGDPLETRVRARGVMHREEPELSEKAGAADPARTPSR
jgi:hypothetical protein